MNTQPTSKTWMWIGGLIAVLAVGYYFMSGGSVPSTSTLTTSSGSDSSAVGSQVLVLLNQIKSLRIDSALFTDAGYRTLRDYSVDIPPLGVGRANPFAPIPGLNTQQSTTH